MKKYNPQLLDKERIIAISKTDMLDDELQNAIEKEIRNANLDIPYLFISSVAQKGLVELKDKLWHLLQKSSV